MARPNFFIVGAAKCGTTALYTYLREHACVFMASPKEPNFFVPDISLRREATTRKEYVALFRDATDQHWRVGEASTMYMYSREAAALVQAHAPQARIVVIVRNPLELLRSWHAQMVYERNEDQEDFSAAWDLRFHRGAGRRVPSSCLDRKLLWYDKIARLGEQTERWLRYFPPERVKIISFDDFRADTGSVYRDVLEFLELPDDHRHSFPVINARKRQRFGLVARFTERTPQTLVRSAMAAKRLLGIKNWGVLAALRRWNCTDAASDEPLDERVSREVLQTYADDVALLSKITGRDFGHWLQWTPGDGMRMSAVARQPIST